MASKSVIWAGASLAKRLFNPILNHPQNLTSASSHVIAPSSKLQSFLPRNDVESMRRVSCQGLLYPCGLPSLQFYLPEVDESSNEPMLLFPKRTYQPSNIRRKRNHGFLARFSAHKFDSFYLEKDARFIKLKSSSLFRPKNQKSLVNQMQSNF